MLSRMLSRRVASSRYRCVPKIASPEARTIFIHKTHCPRYRFVPKIASPEARKNFIHKTHCSRYRCVPKIASPEARKNLNTKTYRAGPHRIRALSLVRGECTTNLQRQAAQNPGSEPSAGREEEERKEEKWVKSKINRTSHKG